MRKRRRGEGGRGMKCTLPAKPRHITMAVFPVSCTSESNQRFYYIILQFLPPISLGGPGASLAPSAQEMFPLQPSVVIGGHIGNQSRNRRRGQRADPPTLGMLLFGQELPLQVESSGKRWTCTLHTHAALPALYIHVCLHIRRWTLRIQK